jgi:hypothetical protein
MIVTKARKLERIAELSKQMTTLSDEIKAWDDLLLVIETEAKKGGSKGILQAKDRLSQETIDDLRLLGYKVESFQSGRKMTVPCWKITW